jgi:hypothetical protein
MKKLVEDRAKMLKSAKNDQDRQIILEEMAAKQRKLEKEFKD